GGWHAERKRREAAFRTALPAALRLGSHHGRRVLRSTLLALAVTAIVLGAARPQWGSEEAEVSQRGIDLVIALDVSRSMLAEDVEPSRATASAQGMREMLVHLTGNRVGLVTFAGTAFERSPLTLDLDALTSLVMRAQQEAPLVQAGTNIASALDAAMRTLAVEDRAQARAILLVTDGEETGGDLATAIRRAQDANIRIYTVFAATEEPTTLPEASGGTDITVGVRDVLARIATETGGEVRNVESIPGLAVEFRRLRQTQFEATTETQPIDRFPWFFAVGLGLLALELAVGEAGRMRRPRLRAGLVTSALTAMLVVGCSGTALYQAVERGNAAYAAGDYEAALAAYEEAAADAPVDAAVQYNIGNTLHLLGRFRDATATGEAALALTTEDADLRLRLEYALGNHAFQAGEIEAARDRYVAALRIDPTDRDAKANLELLLWFLEAPPPEDEEEQPPEEEPSEDDPADPNGEEPESDENGEPGDQPGQGPPSPGTPDQPTPGGASPPGPSGDDPTGPPTEAQTFEEAQAALAEALAELGPVVTREEALRLLELARRANELSPLPSRPGGGVPAR
ncbi:MAG: VWA domain-containing protein, partial [Chloroflexi bacterium]|nr:VWA domain-containing protein [Chloroflexota bacterium]